MKRLRDCLEKTVGELQNKCDSNVIYGLVAHAITKELFAALATSLERH